jgi:hypothetical protein
MPWEVGEFLELGVVFATVAVSLIVMVVLGKWWAR